MSNTNMTVSYSLESHVNDDFVARFEKHLNDSQFSRFQEALTGPYKAYPTTQSTYKVYSYNGEEETVYHAIFPRTDKPHCGCADFYYRGREEEPPFSKCKHLWRVFIETHLGLIPPESAHPYDWIHTRVQSELFDVIDSEDVDKPLASHLRAILRNIEANDKSTLEYNTIYRSWANYNGLDIK